MREPKKESLLELIRAMETFGGKLPESFKLSLKKAYEKEDLNTLIEHIAKYIDGIAPVYSLYKKLKADYEELRETNPNSEAATCEFLISPVLKAVMKEEYRPANVFISNRASNAEIRADYILKRKVLVEAKNLNTNILDKSGNPQKFAFIKVKDKKTDKTKIQNADENHLSQAICYFVEVKHKNIDLKHVILTNGKTWLLIENADSKISCKTNEDLLKLNGTLLPKGSYDIYNLLEWEDFRDLTKRLHQLLYGESYVPDKN